MGNEALCRVSIGGESAEAKALLETEELIVRGALRAKIPFREMQDVAADGGVLRFRWNDRDVRIHAGADAAKWAEKIRNPKSVLDKLGVKAKQRVCVAGRVEDAFLGGRARRREGRPLLRDPHRGETRHPARQTPVTETLQEKQGRDFVP